MKALTRGSTLENFVVFVVIVIGVLFVLALFDGFRRPAPVAEKPIETPVVAGQPAATKVPATEGTSNVVIVGANYPTTKVPEFSRPNNSIQITNEVQLRALIEQATQEQQRTATTK